MNARTDQEIAKEFLALPSTALPSAYSLDWEEVPAWHIVREIAETGTSTYGRVRLHAEREEWASIIIPQAEAKEAQR